MGVLTRIVLFASALFIHWAAYAQQRTISGTVKYVKGGDNLAVESAVINCEFKKSSISILSDSLGRFRIESPFKNISTGDTLIVSVSRIGFDGKIVKVLVDSTKSIEVGSILLNENSDFALDEVKVVAQSNTVTRENEKLIMKVQGTLLKNSVSTVDLLRKTPGVFVDQNNAVSLAGRSGVTIQINGKNTNMQSGALASFLSSIPSSNVERIEVINIPTSSYDAEGFGGVINIVLKNPVSTKLSTTIASTSGYGNNFKNNTSLTMGVSGKKFAIVSFASAPFNKSLNTFQGLRRLNEARIDQHGGVLNTQFDFNYRLNAEFKIDSLTTIGAILNLSHENSASNFTSSSGFFSSNASRSDENVEVRSRSRSWSDNTSANLYFSRQMGGGSKLSGDLDFSRFNQSAGISNQVEEAVSEHFSNRSFSTRSPSTISISSMRVDYSSSLNSKISASFGLKGSIVSTINDFSLDSLLNGVNVPNNDLSNRFDFGQVILSAYGHSNFSLDSTTSIYVGVRLEHTESDGELRSLSQNSRNKDSYLKVFPTLSVNKTFNDNNQVSVSYGYRVNRPNYKDLNPFVFFVSKYDVSKGNPFLRPSFSHNLDATYILNNVFVFTISYTDAKDDFRSVIIQDAESNVAAETKTNLASYRSYRLNTTWPFNIGKRIELFNIFNYAFNDYRSYLGNKKGALVQFYHETTFKFTPSLSAFAAFNFASSGALGLYEVKPFGFLNFGLTKIFKKPDLTIKFNVKDITRSNRPLTVIKYGNVYQETRNIYEGRIFQLSLLLRLGGKIGEMRKSTSSDEEKGRVTR